MQGAYVIAVSILAVVGIAFIGLADFRQARRLTAVLEVIGRHGENLNEERRLWASQILSSMSYAGPLTLKVARRIKDILNASER